MKSTANFRRRYLEATIKPKMHYNGIEQNFNQIKHYEKETKQNKGFET